MRRVESGEREEGEREEGRGRVGGGGESDEERVRVRWGR